VVESLDADIAFGNDYFEFLLGKLASDPNLGLVGTPFEDEGAVYDYRFVSIEHVSGACQVFRRECFEMIGGYQPLRGGSIDHIAVITARMKGWKTRTFTEQRCVYHRATGTAQVDTVRSRFNYGVKDYLVGNHRLWECCRAAYQMTERPWVTGGVWLLFGYLWSAVMRAQRPVSPELVAFQRRDQLRRLQHFIATTGGAISRFRPERVDKGK